MPSNADQRVSPWPARKPACFVLRLDEREVPDIILCEVDGQAAQIDSWRPPTSNLSMPYPPTASPC